jgi:hypothetical protein
MFALSHQGSQNVGQSVPILTLGMMIGKFRQNIKRASCGPKVALAVLKPTNHAIGYCLVGDSESTQLRSIAHANKCVGISGRQGSQKILGEVQRIYHHCESRRWYWIRFSLRCGGHPPVSPNCQEAFRVGFAFC